MAQNTHENKNRRPRDDCADTYRDAQRLWRQFHANTTHKLIKRADVVYIFFSLHGCIARRTPMMMMRFCASAVAVINYVVEEEDPRIVVLHYINKIILFIVFHYKYSIGGSIFIRTWNRKVYYSDSYKITNVILKTKDYQSGARA